jgi:ATP-dependent DNA helicase PIF1
MEVKMNVNLESVSFDYQQGRVIESVLSGKNVYANGKAGTGKSKIIMELKRLRPHGMLIVGPTGISARNIEGTTLHRAFNLPTVKILREEHVNSQNQNFKNMLQSISIVVIDEISMVRADLINVIMGAFKVHCNGKLPQWVLLGDILQLPPVIPDDKVEQYLFSRFGGPYFFNSEMFKELEFEYITLDTSYRQNNAEFVKVLDQIRIGETLTIQHGFVTDNYFKEDTITMDTEIDYLELANQMFYKPGKINPGAICLCATNYMADKINEGALRELPGEEFIFLGQRFNLYPDHLLPASMHLKVKIGMKVMIVANGVDPSGTLYVNGDTGEVIACGHNPDVITVRLRDGRVVSLGKHWWENMDVEYIETSSGNWEMQDFLAGSFSALPVTSASAITIHRSQGQSLDTVNLCMGNRPMWAQGQLYTALSRARSIEGLAIDRPLSYEDVIVGESALTFERRISPSRVSQFAYDLKYGL